MRRACRFTLLCLIAVDAAAAGQGSPQKVRVMSDVHAGSCWQGNQSILFEFLEQTAHDDVDVLVLNGDVYDFWLVPLDKPSPSFEDSIAHGLDPTIGFQMGRFRTLLQKAARSTVTLHEDNGNHDMWLSGDLAQKALGNTTIMWEEQVVKNWDVRFEHGHLHSVFNQVPPGTNKMPIGYFVTRCVAAYACASQDRIQAWLSEVIKGILGTTVIDAVAMEALRHPSVFRHLLHRILETATNSKLPGDMSAPVVGVVSAEAIPLAGDTSDKYTLAHFIDDYADTLEKVVEKVGHAAAARLIMADVVPGALDYSVGQTSVNESLVVIGHTHVPSLQIVSRDVPYASPTPDVLVANAGAWVADDTGVPQSSYVDITMEEVVEDHPQCYTKQNGEDYRGLVSNTHDGTACKPWGHDVITSKYYRAFGSVSFCRNLGEWTSPWCWTGFDSWGNCSVGPPSSLCKQETRRAPVAVYLWSYPNKLLASATRHASTASRWQMTKTMDGEAVYAETEPIVV